MTHASATVSRTAFVFGELAKVPAFVRRDFLVAWSYRLPFVSDLLALFVQAFLFYFVGLMVDPEKLPKYGGSPVSYMEFVAIGIVLAAFIQVGLGRVAGAIRGEQLMGTLESLMMTPTASSTIQLGSAAYDLVYIPIRTVLFLFFIAVAFGLEFELSGIPIAIAIVLAFIPFVWGLGLMSAGAMMTFRQGGNRAVGLGVTLMTLASGAYFPLDLLPGWLQTAAQANPMAIAIGGMREALLADSGWGEAARALALLAPIAAVSLVVGLGSFRAALRRERRSGTLGIY